MICILRDSLDDRWKRITNFQIYQLNYHACLILHGIFQYFPSDRFCGSCNSSIYWKIWCTNNSHLSTIEVSLLCTKTEKRSCTRKSCNNWCRDFRYVLKLIFTVIPRLARFLWQPENRVRWNSCYASLYYD